MGARNPQKSLKSNKSLFFFYFLVNSGEDWLSLMVVVRVVVSVTEVLRCLRLCSAGAVSVGAGSDVAVLGWLFCSGVGLTFW